MSVAYMHLRPLPRPHCLSQGCNFDDVWKFSIAQYERSCRIDTNGRARTSPLLRFLVHSWYGNIILMLKSRHALTRCILSSRCPCLLVFYLPAALNPSALACPLSPVVSRSAQFSPDCFEKKTPHFSLPSTLNDFDSCSLLFDCIFPPAFCLRDRLYITIKLPRRVWSPAFDDAGVPCVSFWGCRAGNINIHICPHAPAG